MTQQRQHKVVFANIQIHKAKKYLYEKHDLHQFLEKIDAKLENMLNDTSMDLSIEVGLQYWIRSLKWPILNRLSHDDILRVRDEVLLRGTCHWQHH